MSVGQISDDKTTCKMTDLCIVDIADKQKTKSIRDGPLARYVNLQIAHASGMPGTFFPIADFKGNRQLAIPAYTTARALSTCRDACRDNLPAVAGKTFPAFQAHAHPQFYVFGKRPVAGLGLVTDQGPFGIHRAPGIDMDGLNPYPLWYVRWNYWSLLELQRWNFRMVK